MRKEGKKEEDCRKSLLKTKRKRQRKHKRKKPPEAQKAQQRTGPMFSARRVKEFGSRTF